MTIILKRRGHPKVKKWGAVTYRLLRATPPSNALLHLAPVYKAGISTRYDETRLRTIVIVLSSLVPENEVL